MEHVKVGTAEMLIPRLYPLDGEAQPHTPGAEMRGRSVVVEPGSYPIYQVDEAVYVLWSGRMNAADFHKIGDGLFAMGGEVRGEGPVLTFPSRSWSRREFEELIHDTSLLGRVRYTLDV